MNFLLSRILDCQRIRAQSSLPALRVQLKSSLSSSDVNRCSPFCRLNPTDISLSDGKAVNHEFEEVPMIRFRKSLTS
jgi:hypothetical protein